MDFGHSVMKFQVNLRQCDEQVVVTSDNEPPPGLPEDPKDTSFLTRQQL